MARKTWIISAIGLLLVLAVAGTMVLRHRTKFANTFIAHEGVVGTLAFMPDGKQVVSGGGDGVIRLWDVASRTQVAEFKGHTENLLQVAVSPDGSKLASGAQDKTAILWSVPGAKELRRFTFPEASVSVALHPDGVRLATANATNIQLWDTRDGKELDKFAGEGRSPDLFFSADGQWLFQINSEQGELTVCDVNHHGRLVRRLALPAEYAHLGMWCAVATRDQKYAVAGGEVGHILMWELPSGAPMPRFRNNPNWHRVYTMALSPDERYLFTAGQGPMELWDSHSGKIVQSFEAPLETAQGTVTEVLFSPSGDRIVGGTTEGRIFMISLGHGRTQPPPLRSEGPRTER